MTLFPMPDEFRLTRKGNRVPDLTPEQMWELRAELVQRLDEIEAWEGGRGSYETVRNHQAVLEWRQRPSWGSTFVGRAC
jgi:hypothetical protein